ncbi:MAG: hypothetical protein ABIR55_17500, partial [Burkholderiaceae bacterium]
QNAPTTLLRHITTLPPAADKAARAFSKGRWHNSQDSSGAGGAHWLSHCGRCDARLDEGFTLGPDGPFHPRLYKHRKAITLERLSGPFVLEHVQNVPSLPLLSWLEWHNDRQRRAHAVPPHQRRAGAVVSRHKGKPHGA